MICTWYTDECFIEALAETLSSIIMYPRWFTWGYWKTNSRKWNLDYTFIQWIPSSLFASHFTTPSPPPPFSSYLSHPFPIHLNPPFPSQLSPPSSAWTVPSTPTWTFPSLLTFTGVAIPMRLGSTLDSPPDCCWGSCEYTTSPLLSTCTNPTWLQSAEKARKNNEQKVQHWNYGVMVAKVYHVWISWILALPDHA